MGFGFALSEIKIIWIDKNVNNEKNKKYRKQIRSYEKIDLECFEEIPKGMDYIKEIKFQKTIIITSGRIFPEFYYSLKQCEHDLYIIPKIIIFTGDADTFYSQVDKTLPINDSFYNIGKVVDEMKDVKDFIDKERLYNYDFKFKKDEKKRFKNEELKFQTISDKNELILPIFYSKFLIKSTEEQINNFNSKVLNNIDDDIIQFLFSQIVNVKNIPINILTKFWLKAYSTQGTFNEKINDKLSKSDYKDYLPFIQKLYEVANTCIYESDTEKLYKGINAPESVWSTFIKTFKEKEFDKAVPKAIIYGKSFFSFYKNEALSRKIKEEEEDRHFYFITLIIENANDCISIKNHANINKDISCFEKDDEVVFFPFSCFEIKQIKNVNENEYIIILNYLDKYSNIFKEEVNTIFKNIPKNEYSELVLNSGIIDLKSIDKPRWFNISLDNTSAQININNYVSNPLHIQNNSITDSNNNNAQFNNNINNMNNNIGNTINNNFNNSNNGNIIKNSYCDNIDYYSNNNNPYNINPNQNLVMQNNQNQNQNNNSQNFKVIQKINDYHLLSSVFNICKYSISQCNYTDFEQLRQIINNNLISTFNGIWWVNINNRILNNFGNIGPNSVMIFQYMNMNMNIFIHVAKIK